MDCSPPGSSVHGILQARILEWVTISLSRESSRPRDRTQISCKAGSLYCWVTREALSARYSCPIFSLLQLSLTFEKQTLLFTHSKLYHVHCSRCKNLQTKRLKCSMGVSATFSNPSTRHPRQGFLSLSALHISAKSKVQHQKKVFRLLLGQSDFRHTDRKVAGEKLMLTLRNWLLPFLLLWNALCTAPCEMTARQCCNTIPLKTSCACTKH